MHALAVNIISDLIITIWCTNLEKWGFSKMQNGKKK